MHLISIQDLKMEEIDHVVSIKNLNWEYKQEPQVGLLFLEKSLRTKHSFISACNLLGWKYIDFSYNDMHSEESMVDFLTTCLMYVDILIIRSPHRNLVHVAKTISEEKFKNKVIINAGNADVEHPTQALTDYFTMLKYSEKEDIKPKFFSKPSCRAVNSLTYLLKMANGYNKNDLIPTDKVNFIYVSRGYTGLIDKDITKKYYNAYILHPLPRGGELSTELDGYEKSLYFEQVYNGTNVRASLMQFLLRN